MALSGPRAYDGRLREFPFVHEAGRKMIGADEIDATVRLLWRVWAAGLALTVAAALLLAG